MKKRTEESRGGSLMLIVMCYLFIMTALLATWLSATITDSRLISRTISRTAALYLAEAGVEHAKEWLTAQADLRSAVIRSAGTIPASTVLGAGSVPLGNGSYTSSVEVELGSWSIPIYTISSIGTCDPDGVAGSGDELRRKIVVKALLGSFARYAYYTDTEGSNIWFTTTDALLGLVHTNGSLRISGRPDFWGKVTSVGTRFTYYNNGHSVTSTAASNGTADVPHFRDGYELGADEVALPTDTSEMETAAAGASGLIINSDTEITLSADGDAGRLDYTTQEDRQVWVVDFGHTHTWIGDHAGINHKTRYSQYHEHGHYETDTVTTTYTTDVYNSEESPSGKAIVYVNGDAEVSGTLAGQLTILTEGDLIVKDDILYHVNPVDYDQDGLLSDPNDSGENDAGYDRNGDGLYTLPGEAADDTDDDGNGASDVQGYDQPESTDTLGLVSKSDVVIADPGTEGVNRTISGSVMAIGSEGGTGSFRVENYSNGDVQGTLTVIGGIIQKQRGAVGTFNGSTKTSGYSKSYIYDSRLIYFPPPYFPPTKMLDLIYWQEVPL